MGKLKSSGLTVKDAEKLGILYLGREEVQKLHPKFPPLKSLKICYFDHRGQPLEDVPGGGQFYRLRYLEEQKGFEALTQKKPQRYTQPPGTVPAAYYPRGGADWAKVVADPGAPLILTEGEFKAAKACAEGFPTIGLGGVYNWKSPKNGVTWLPSLEPVRWCRRNVYVIFDSDLRTNKLVQAGLHELAQQLERRGAFVHVALLPQLKDLPKVGLDDFLIHSGADALADLLHEAEPLGLGAPLWAFNDRFLYVKDPGLIYDVKTQFKMAPGAFKEHAQSTEEYHQRVLRGDTVTFEPVSAASAWLKWPMRSEVDRLTYMPGKPERVEGMHNIWPGWGVEPKKGSVKPFLQLLEHLFTGAEPGALDWFLKWCAYPLQYPGTKLYSAAVIHGIVHGTGKSFVGYSLGRIYGKNFTEIRQKDLHGNFNEWAEGKQFVLADDVTGQDKRSDADLIKNMITQRELRVNAKYIPTYVVPDCVNYLFTSNHPDAFYIEDADRRLFVHEVIVGTLPEEFYKDYELWLDSGGSSALFHYLLNLDVGDFNPAGPAMRTSAKERMTATVRSDLAAWVRQLRSVPQQVLRLGEIEVKKDLFTTKELLTFYDPEQRTGTTANGLGRELSRAGIRQVMGGSPVRLSDGSQARYYAVRNAEKWLSASQSAVAAHVEGWARGSSKRTKY